MRFELVGLNGKSLSELRDIFSSIALAETELELVGDFNPTSRFGTSIIAESLAFLPRHVATVKFSGTYAYSSNGSYERWDGIRSSPGWGDGVDITETIYCFKREVGRLLERFILSLPATVNSLLFDFKYNPEYERTDVFSTSRTTVCTVSEDFKRILQKLPRYITYVNFCGTHFVINTGIERMLGGIPSTVEKLGLGRMGLGHRSFLERCAIYSATNRGLATVHLNNNELSELNAPFARYFEGLPDNLKELSIGYNNLGRRSGTDISAIFRELPKKLICVRLNGNQLALRSAAELAAALSFLPATLREVDLGENGLLAMRVGDFSMVLAGLPRTINAVRLCERSGHHLTGAAISARLACLPVHITTLSVSSSNLLGLPIADFITSLSHLPIWIDTLDLSDNTLCTRSPAELTLLFSSLPAGIKTIKLNRNALCSLDAAVLRDIFASLPKTVETIDLRENGFDRVLHTRLNGLLDSLPDIKLSIEMDTLGIRNDGALVTHSPLSHLGLFKPEGQLRHQKELASMLLMLGQLMSDKHLNASIMQRILSMLLGSTTPARMKQMVGKIETATTLMSAIPPAVITPTTELECRRAIDARITALVVGATKLDLSHCGLNRLDTDDKLKTVFQLTPRTVCSLSLRGNGFSYTEDNRVILINALEKIRPEIKYLDLSGNGFEHDDGLRLAQLFSRLPATVEWVSLSHEKPASPADHIANRTWPLSYRALASKSSDVLMQARTILDDYTKGDSATRRFFYGHWNRHHAKEVAKIVQSIDKRRITNVQDVLSELELIDVLNPAGSLTKRVAFLFKTSLVSARGERIEATGGLEGLEMRPLIGPS